MHGNVQCKETNDPCLMTLYALSVMLLWSVECRDHFYEYALTLTPSWMSIHIHYGVWNEITYPFLNLYGVDVEDWKWISNFIPHFTGHVITYPC